MKNNHAKIIAALRRKSDRIINIWKERLQSRPRTAPINLELERALTVLLQLVLTRLEYDYFEEHLSFLDRHVRERLSAGEPVEAPLLELRTLKAVLLSECELREEPESLLDFAELLDSIFYECIAAVMREHARRADEEKSKIIENLKKWNFNLVDLVPVPVLAVDGDGNIKRANEAWCRAVGSSEDSLIGQPVEEILGKPARRQLDAVLARGEPDKAIPFPAAHGGGTFPPAAHYEWRAIRDEGRTAGAALLALPSGMRPRDRQKDALLKDITSGKTSFSRRMRELRKSLAIPLATLARKAGRARGYISNVENGKVVPSFAVMASIAEILDPEGNEDLLLSGIITKIPPEMRRHLPWI